ncbi:MAG: hypothetical protein H7Y03_14760 [Chitinophagaceae bacterium]|nr:hypothetical protein [Chitinophagaceae bacterium]
MTLPKAIIDKLLLLPSDIEIGASRSNKIQVYQCRLVVGLHFQCLVAPCDLEGAPLPNEQLTLVIYDGGLKESILATYKIIMESSESALIKLIRETHSKQDRPRHRSY